MTWSGCQILRDYCATGEICRVWVYCIWCMTWRHLSWLQWSSLSWERCPVHRCLSYCVSQIPLSSFARHCCAPIACHACHPTHVEDNTAVTLVVLCGRQYYSHPYGSVLHGRQYRSHLCCPMWKRAVAESCPWCCRLNLLGSWWQHNVPDAYGLWVCIARSYLSIYLHLPASTSHVICNQEIKDCLAVHIMI